jgi:hypothetical protein
MTDVDIGHRIGAISRTWPELTADQVRHLDAAL